MIATSRLCKITAAVIINYVSGLCLFGWLNRLSRLIFLEKVVGELSSWVSGTIISSSNKFSSFMSRAVS